MTDLVTKGDARALTQQKFLENFALFGTISRAASEVKVHRSTIYDWLNNDIAFSQAFADAIQGYRDTIKDAIHQRAITGTQTPLVSRGQLVMDAHGNPVMVTRHSDQLLGLLARAYIKDFRVSPDDSMNTGIQVTDKSLVIPDIRKLDSDVLERLIIDLERINNEAVNSVESELTGE